MQQPHDEEAKLAKNQNKLMKLETFRLSAPAQATLLDMPCCCCMLPSNEIRKNVNLERRILFSFPFVRPQRLVCFFSLLLQPRTFTVHLVCSLLCSGLVSSTYHIAIIFEVTTGIRVEQFLVT